MEKKLDMIKSWPNWLQEVKELNKVIYELILKIQGVEIKQQGVEIWHNMSSS